MAAATSSVEPFLVANVTRIWLKAYTSYHKMMWLPANRGVGPNVTSVVMTLVSAISMTGDSERIGRGAARTRVRHLSRARHVARSKCPHGIGLADCVLAGTSGSSPVHP